MFALKITPSCYNCAKLEEFDCHPGGGRQRFWSYTKLTGKGLSLFTFSRHAAKKMNVFAWW